MTLHLFWLCWIVSVEAHTDDAPFCRYGACHFEQDRMERYVIGPLERREIEIADALDLYHAESGYMARQMEVARILAREVMLI